MRITFHGAAHTVTGSQHLIEVDDKRILLDCGLHQGRRQESFERNKKLPFDPASIDVLVLSHAHIDHSGNIPNLVKNGFKLFKSTLFSAVLAKSMSPEAAKARAQLLSGSLGRQGSMEAPKQVQIVPGGACVEPLRKICRRSRRFRKIYVGDIGPYSSL